MPKTQIGILAAVVVSTSLLLAAPARADSSDDFLAAVSALGIKAGDTGADVGITLDNGLTICDIIRMGYSPEVASHQVKYMYPDPTPQQVAGFVDAAQSTLCAWHETPLQSGGVY